MKTFIVRTNCEYSIQIEADNWEQACDIADVTPIDDWTQAWGECEVEEET